MSRKTRVRGFLSADCRSAHIENGDGNWPVSLTPELTALLSQGDGAGFSPSAEHLLVTEIQGPNLPARFQPPAPCRASSTEPPDAHTGRAPPAGVRLRPRAWRLAQ